MPCIKHSGFRSRMLAIIFLFLNCVCIASNGIKNTTDDYNQAISLQFGHDFNTLESEENQLPTSSFINHLSRSSVTLKNHNCNGNFYCNASVLSFQKCCNPSIASDFLPKPGNYTFLFRYTLF